ncbi:MAG: STAS domain-containing protein [Acidimicrobiales bacterium]
MTERGVKVSGDVDLSTSSSMIAAVLTAPVAELDLSEVTFMDSSGLHALIRLSTERAGLHIVAVSSPVQRLFELSRMTEHLMLQNGSGS